MGDGKFEMQSDVSKTFDVQERQHESGKMMVSSTSCRMVSFETFEKEKKKLISNIEKGITSSLTVFNNLMYVVVRKRIF